MKMFVDEGYDGIGTMPTAPERYAQMLLVMCDEETMQTVNLSNQIISQFDYTVYPTGHRHTLTDLAGNVSTYIYDDLYRLTQETVNHNTLGNVVNIYDYDAVGNRISATENGVTTTYTHDNNDRLLTSLSSGITTTYAYDDNGNTLSKTDNSAATNASHFTYDAKNKLIFVEQLQNGTPNNSIDYQYDIDGNRIQKADNSGITNFVVDRNQSFAQVVHETDEQHQTQVTYTHGDDLISQDRVANISYYHYDELGSTRSLTDTTGLITDTYDYNAYGTLLDQSGSTANSYLYTGEQFDSALDNCYLRARYYDPSNGRFTQMDSFQGWENDPITLHKYLYVHADPINGIDPSGNAGLFGFSVAQNINAVLITASVASASYNIFQIATGEKELTAKEVGLTVLMAAAGPAAGKLVKLLAPKFSKLSSAAKFALLQKRLFGSLKAVRPRSLDRIELPVGGITKLSANTINSLKKNEVYVYVVDNSNNLLVAVRGSAGKPGVKHTQLTGGESAKAAGELMVTDGKILLNNSSGRYRTQAADAVNKVKTLLQGLGNIADITGPL